MYEEHAFGYTMYYADSNPNSPKNQSSEPNGDDYKSPIRKLREDPNIEIVTKVPGLVWDIRYKVPPPEKKESRIKGMFRRAFRK